MKIKPIKSSLKVTLLLPVAAVGGVAMCAAFAFLKIKDKIKDNKSKK